MIQRANHQPARDMKSPFTLQNLYYSTETH